MTKQQSVEFFMPPNMLKAKVGGGSGRLDKAAIKRAELVMANLKKDFGQWIEADVERLSERFDVFVAEASDSARDDLFRASLDLKGQASTFEFPLAARIASSLCRLLNERDLSTAVPLIEAHVAAIRVIVRDKVMDRTNAIANALAAELENRVKKFHAHAK